MTHNPVSIPVAFDWRKRSLESWRGRKAVLASRGETTGDRVNECDAALNAWRLRGLLIRDFGMTEDQADQQIQQALAAKITA